MSKNTFIKSSLYLSILMSLNVHANNYKSSAEQLEFTYKARNVYIAEQNEYVCEVDFSGNIENEQKVAGRAFGEGTIVSIETTRYKQIPEEDKNENTKTYLGKETLFGILEKSGNTVSINRKAFFARDEQSDAQCLVTNISIAGIPKIKLAPSADKQSGIAYLPSGELEEGPLTEESIILDLLSLPFIIQISENLEPEYAKLIPLDTTANDFRLTQTGTDKGYALFLRKVLSGETGLNGSYRNGLSKNFLELERTFSINEFLRTALIEPAIDFGITTEEFNTYAFADALRRYILAELEQDAHYEYGSKDNAMATMILQYSSDISPNIQSFSNSDFYSKDLLEQWNLVVSEYEKSVQINQPPVMYPTLYSEPDFTGRELDFSAYDVYQETEYYANDLKEQLGYELAQTKPISLRVPEGWTVYLWDKEVDNAKEQVYVGPFEGQVEFFPESVESFKYPATGKAVGRVSEELKEKYQDYNDTAAFNIHPDTALSHLLLSIQFPDLDGIELAKAVFSGNENIQLDFDKGILLSNRSNGYLGKSIIDIAKDVYEKESLEDLEQWEILSVQLSLEAIGIDTTYPYGSLSNIKASLLNRISRQLSKDVLSKFFGTGLESALFDALIENGEITSDEIHKALHYYTYEVYTNSNLNLQFGSNFDKQTSGKYIYENLQEWYLANQSLQEELVLIDYQVSAELDEKNKVVFNSEIKGDLQPIYGYPLTDEQYAKARLYSYGATKEEVDHLWKGYLKHGRLNLVRGHGYTVSDILIAKDNERLGNLVQTIQKQWKDDYPALSRKIAILVGSAIDAKAKLQGFSTFKENDLFSQKMRLNTGFSITHTFYEQESLNGLPSTTTNVDPTQWILNGDHLEYIVKIGPDIFDFLDLDSIQIGNKINYDDVSDTADIFRLLHHKKGNECTEFNDNGASYDFKTCNLQFNETSTSNNVAKSETDFSTDAQIVNGPLKYPLIFEGHVDGAFKGWFRVDYVDSTGQWVEYDSPSLFTNQRWRHEIPVTATNIRIRTFVETGLVGQPNRTISDITDIVNTDRYQFGGREYYAIRSKGTTLHSSAESYKPVMERIENERGMLIKTIDDFLVENRGMLQTTVSDAEIVHMVLQGLVPIWATVDDFKQQNYVAGTLGLISDIAFFLPIAKVFTKSSKLLFQVLKLTSRRAFMKQGLNIIIDGKVILNAIDIDPKQAAKLATQAIAEVPLAIIKEINPIPFDALSAGVRRASNAISDRIAATKVNNTSSVSPKIYHSRDFTINENKYPPVDVDEVLGIPESHRSTMLEVVNKENIVMGIRPVDVKNKSLLDSGLYSTKNLLVKAKSSDWGPHSGFIPFDQKYAKASARAQVEKYNAYAHTSVNANVAAKVDLTLTQERVDELLSFNPPAFTDYKPLEGTEYFQGVANETTFYFKKNDDGMISVYIKNNGEYLPLEVLADPFSQKPMIADYDLLTVMVHYSNLDHRDNLRLPGKTHAEWKKMVDQEMDELGITEVPEAIADIYHDKNLYDAQYNLSLGTISERVKSVKNKINNSLGRVNGMEVIHHGADTANPGSIVAENFPASFYVPDRYLKGDAFGVNSGNLTDYFNHDGNGTILINSPEEFADFHQLMANSMYVGPLNKIWGKQVSYLANKHKVSHFFANARDAVEQALSSGIHIDRLNDNVAKDIPDLSFKAHHISHHDIKDMHINADIVDIDGTSENKYLITVKSQTVKNAVTYESFWAIRLGWEFYPYQEIDGKEYIVDPNNPERKVAIMMDSEGKWKNDDGTTDSTQNCNLTDPTALDYPNWNNSSEYNNGDEVRHNGLVYRARDHHGTGIEPTLFSDVWELVSDIQLPWHHSQIYHTGDVVEHIDQLWEAREYISNGSEPNFQQYPYPWKRIGRASCYNSYEPILTIYTEPHFKGESKSYYELEKYLGDMDDALASYKIRKGFSVLFYEDEWLSGPAHTRHWNSPDRSTADDIKYKITSFEVIKYDSNHN